MSSADRRSTSSPPAPKTRSPTSRRSTTIWSAEVTAHSHALDLDQNVFTWTDARRIAASLKRSAERSTRRKSSPYQSAMSMLTFYINRAGRTLDPRQRAVLEQAKQALRDQFGRL